MISINDQRILHYNSGSDTWTDYSKKLLKFDDDDVSLSISTSEYLYFGSFLPFNNRSFVISTANASAANLSIETFDGSKWVSVNEIFDYTELSGVPLASSGLIQFTLNRDQAWTFVGDTLDNAFLTEFSSGPEIYDKYWLRISSDNSISATIKYIGNILCDEDELLSEYPALSANQLYSSWELNKTDWEEQRILASEYVITDLKRRNIIIERSQVVETSVLKEAAIHKSAEIIYNGLGPRNYAEEIISCGARYKDSMNLNKFEQDESQDGQKDRYEQTISTHRASR